MFVLGISWQEICPLETRAPPVRFITYLYNSKMLNETFMRYKITNALFSRIVSDELVSQLIRELAVSSVGNAVFPETIVNQLQRQDSSLFEPSHDRARFSPVDVSQQQQALLSRLLLGQQIAGLQQRGQTDAFRSFGGGAMNARENTATASNSLF